MKVKKIVMTAINKNESAGENVVIGQTTANLATPYEPADNEAGQAVGGVIESPKWCH